MKIDSLRSFSVKRESILKSSRWYHSLSDIAALIVAENQFTDIIPSPIKFVNWYILAFQNVKKGFERKKIPQQPEHNSFDKVVQKRKDGETEFRENCIFKPQRNNLYFDILFAFLNGKIREGGLLLWGAAKVFNYMYFDTFAKVIIRKQWNMIF